MAVVSSFVDGSRILLSIEIYLPPQIYHQLSV
jgi:predicted DNA-binding protein (UPF0278 family)